MVLIVKVNVNLRWISRDEHALIQTLLCNLYQIRYIRFGLPTKIPQELQKENHESYVRVLHVSLHNVTAHN